MKKLCLAFIFLLLSWSSFATELVEIEALNGKVTIRAPKEFGAMSSEMVALKYPSSQRPTEVLSDETGGVTMAFNHTDSPMQPSAVKVAHKSISQMFHNMYPSATWYRDEVIEQNGTTFMVMELVTPAMDTQIHNIMYATSVDGRFLLVAFNTTVEQSDKWLPIGKQIMASMKVND